LPVRHRDYNRVFLRLFNRLFASAKEKDKGDGR
jgi:hypothetical protein